MTATTVERLVVNEPGVYEMDAGTYHADPVPGGSLSSSGARKLLPPGCPARFRYERDSGQAPKNEFDLGHAAHQLVLGDGPELVVIKANNYQTKAARQQRDEAYERGAVPLLPGEHDQVQAMAAALRAHPVASALFHPERGKPEQALFWLDERSGVMRRALLDWLPNRGSGRSILVDYKTCHAADVESLSRAVVNFGYHQQAAWNLDGAWALGLAGPDAAFLFAAQEKVPPYLVTIIELDHVALRIGESRNRRALDIYARCVAEDHWPPYSEQVELVSLPRWAEIQEGES